MSEINDMIAKLETTIKEGNKDMRLDIKALSDSIIELKVQAAATNEHLKNLNGKVIAQEERLQKAESEIIKNRISDVKLGAMIVISSVAGGSAGSLVLKLLGV